MSENPTQRMWPKRRRLPSSIVSALIGAGVAVTVMAVAVIALALTGGHSAAKRRVRTAAISSGHRANVSSSGGLTAAQIYKRDSQGVVTIKAVTAEGQDEGTGIVLNNEGLIVTNDHVVQGATSITIDAAGTSKSTVPATLVGEEANEDLALIRVNPSGLGLKPLTLADSSSVAVGASVYAIGNPYGLEETLTRGIISALNREISAPDGATISGVIQTDAALNPGNSGGPLLNEEGQVIGINSQIASDQSSSSGSQPGNTGIGFAVASNTVAQAVRTIEEGKGASYSSHAGSAEGYGQQQSPYGQEQSPYGRGQYGGGTPQLEGEGPEEGLGAEQPEGEAGRGVQEGPGAEGGAVEGIPGREVETVPGTGAVIVP